MVSESDDNRRSKDTETPTDTRSCRRTLLAGVAAVVPLAGCLDTASISGGSDDESGGDDDPDDPLDTDDARLATVYEYLEAAAAEDLDRMDELAHSENPLNPAAWVEDGWEFRGGGGDEADLEAIDAEVIDEEPTVEDVFELEAAEFWFDEDEFDETIGDAELAMVAVTTDEPSEDESRWVLATEDGEWRHLFVGMIEDRPNPEEVFEEPIEDEDDDVVVEIDWDPEQASGDIPQAAIVLTDERGVDASRIQAESSIEGAMSATYDNDDGEIEANWEGSTIFVAYDTSGDQIVVTAIDEAESDSEIVHREQYEP